MAHTLVKADVMERVQRFAQKLQQIEEIQRFRLVEQTVNESNRVQGLIEKIKRAQKELVHANHYEKLDYKRHLERELNTLNEELENLPAVKEYQQSQVEMNELLQLVQQAIASQVSRRLEVETGGEVRSGCGSGGPCGCK